MATSKSARSIKTEESYTSHMKQFMWFCAYHPAVKTAGPEELARLYVESKARQWSQSSVDVFRPLGDLGQWAQARRPKRLPTWLAHDDMMKLLSCMKGTTRLTMRRESPMDRDAEAANVVPFSTMARAA